MKKLKLAILLSLITCSVSVFGQLEMKFKAQLLDSTINSESSEVAPVFSADGNTMYFVRSNHPENRFGKRDSQDIWKSVKSNGKWGEAERLSDSVNLTKNNAVYAVLSSGDLLIAGEFNSKGQYVRRGLSSIVPDGSQLPKTIKVKGLPIRKNSRAASIAIDSSETMMVLSYSTWRALKKNELYYSTLEEGMWSRPLKLDNLNSKLTEESPFLGKDGTLYFSSDRDGSHDIYFATASDSGENKWNAPEKLEGDLSSGEYEGFLVLDGKEEYAYFSSNRGGDKADIYRLQVKDVREYIFLKGFVVNEKTGQNLVGGKPFDLKITTVDSLGKLVVVNPEAFRKVEDSAYFEYQLPFGKVYTMTADVNDKHYSESPVSIDLSKVEDYKVINKNAKLKAVPFLTVEGKVDLIDYDPSIMSIDNSGIYVNGELQEDVKVNDDGTFVMELPLGKKYTIESRKPHYQPFPVVIDVTNAKDNVNKNADVKMRLVPDIYSYLNAKVINKKTQLPMDKDSYEIFVNGVLAPGYMVTKNDNGFDLQMEIGQNYFVMVKSPNFINAYDSLDFRKAKLKEQKSNTFELAPIEVGTTVKIENINFASGSSVLTPESFIELNRVVNFMNEYPSVKIEISGHTDNRGSAYLNKKLSGLRAKSVADYLVKSGIDTERLTSNGYGFEKPLVDNNTRVNRAINRRVEFTILSNE